MDTPLDEQMNPAAALQCVLDGKRVAPIDWPPTMWLREWRGVVVVERVDDDWKAPWDPGRTDLTRTRYRLVN